MGAAGGYISGGPIYQRNKALFLQQRGWSVYYISCCHGKIYISGLEDFIVETCTFLTKPAYLFPQKYHQILLNYILKKLPHQMGDVVIETGTDYTAYWGELLAEKLNGRHIITLLDEYNDKITSKVAPFYKFKYGRKELACISDEVMIHIFSSFIPECKAKQYSLVCYCSNSLENVNPLWVSDIPSGDLVVGYIGRLEKKAMPFILDGIRKYADENKDKKIVFLCIGGSDNHSIGRNIKNFLIDCANVAVYITGFLFPIPLKCVEKCDIIFSTAGSCLVGARASVPTVRIHQINNTIQGFIQKYSSKEYYVYENANTVFDYIKLFSQGTPCPRLDKYDINKEWKTIEGYFDKHLDFLAKADSKFDYFNFKKINLNWKERLYKYSFFLLGMRLHHLLWKK